MEEHEKSLQANEHKRFVLSQGQEAGRFLDKAIITISSGALVFSFSRLIEIKNLSHSEPEFAILISISWILLLLTILCTIVYEFLFSKSFADVLKINKRIADAQPPEAADIEKLEKNDKRCNILWHSSVILFVLGMCLLSFTLIAWFLS